MSQDMALEKKIDESEFIQRSISKEAPTYDDSVTQMRTNRENTFTFKDDTFEDT